MRISGFSSALHFVFFAIHTFSVINLLHLYFKDGFAVSQCLSSSTRMQHFSVVRQRGASNAILSGIGQREEFCWGRQRKGGAGKH